MWPRAPVKCNARSCERSSTAVEALASLRGQNGWHAHGADNDERVFTPPVIQRLRTSYTEDTGHSLPHTASRAIRCNSVPKVLIFVQFVQQILQALGGRSVPAAATHRDVHAVRAGAAEHEVCKQEVLQFAHDRQAILIRIFEELHVDVGEVLVSCVEEGSQGVVGHALDYHLIKKRGGRVHVSED